MQVFWEERLTKAWNPIEFLGFKNYSFMSKVKSQYCTWRCPDCNKPNSVTAYDKRRDSEIKKELSMYCNQCRAHSNHKRKDTKKGN